MKVLHTSDWHLGRSLYDKRRYDEHGAFLDWLSGFIKAQKIDILLVAGDIFDTTTPGNRAQELYYDFLAKLPSTGCRHAVITGGNHDSPTFLDAPGLVLKSLGVHVVGAAIDNPAEEVIVLRNPDGHPEAVVCAVPFLRDRDIRTVEAGEDPGDKTRKLLEGVARHYAEVSAAANILPERHDSLPVIGMGHLFTQNGTTTEGDGVRELYVGSLAHIDETTISAGFDYLALGHLHLAQQAGGSETVRYSGSPIPMGFSEAGQVKKVIIVEFEGKRPVITEHPIPCFQELVRISGDLQQVSERMGRLKEAASRAWLEIEIKSTETAAWITGWLDELLEGSKMEVLRVKNRSIMEHSLTPLSEAESLETLTDTDVFTRCLDANAIEGDARAVLLETYREALHQMSQEDPNAI